jgi:glutamate-5-semialdehyde dehydrogenase
LSRETVAAGFPKRPAVGEGSRVSDIAEIRDAVHEAAAAARRAAGGLEAAGEDTIRGVLLDMGRNLVARSAELRAANRRDVDAARASGMSPGLLDRLITDDARIEGMADQLEVLANTPAEPRIRKLRDLDAATVVLEKRRAVGVLGANFEARPNVTVDMASQALRSRNACVLRTGAAALRTAEALVDLVIGPALEGRGLSGDCVRLLRTADRAAAEQLVQHPDGIPLVILRGSGDTTRSLARKAAEAGVAALAHADGGGVLYVHPAADDETVTRLIDESTDRLGVCNRLNLLLVDTAVFDEVVPRIREQLAAHRPAIELVDPSPQRPLGWEWALDDANNATVTVAAVTGPLEAAEIANRETSGLAATIATEDDDAAAAFLAAYAGTGGFHNRTTRLLDGFKLLAVPETGINVGRGPGPRGPVTFRDLWIRQYLTVPTASAARLLHE